MRNMLMGWLAAAALTGVGFADVTAVWAMQEGGELVVRHADDANFSMMMRDKKGRDSGGVIVKNGKTYSVAGSGADAVVYDMDAMADAMRSSGVGAMISGMMARQDRGSNDDFELDEFKKTGRKETHAGVTGDVYLAVDGRGREQEVVLTKNDRVETATRAMMLAGVKMSEMAGRMGAMQMSSNISGKLNKMMERELGGVLRSEGMTLKSVDGGALPRGALDLPAEPQAMPDMGAMFGGRN